jgi:hypothetical protein
MASGGCPGIPDGTVRFPDCLGFDRASEASTRDRRVLVGRLEDRFERFVRSFFIWRCVCARPVHPAGMTASGCRDGAMGGLDDELEAQVARSC